MADRSSRAAPEDARIPCPVCGQQIHPVAGRCKHCKTDLVRLREQRGVRAPRIDPAMIGAAAAMPVAVPTPFGAPAPMPMPEPVELQPTVVGYAEPKSWTRRWPILVAIVAGLAIIVCAYLLLFDKGSDAPKKVTGVGPAADHMNTQVDPPPPPPITTHPGGTGGLADPWNQGNGATPPPALPPTFDTPTTPDPVPNPSPPTASGVPAAADFPGAMTAAMCTAITNCLGSAAKSICDLVADPSANDYLRQQVQNGNCSYDQDKAKHCLDEVQSIQCKSMSSNDMTSLFSGFADCTSALVCH